jgi:hypothetical protein
LFKDHESALIIERDPAAFRKAVIELRDNPELRINLGKKARQSLIEKKWDWKSKAEDYRLFFRSAGESSTKNNDGSAMAEGAVAPENPMHYLGILQSQLLASGDAQGDWILIYDLNQKIKHLLNDVKALK